MIAIDFKVREWHWLYQISTTFFVCVILPLLSYIYAKYISKTPNRYNKLEDPPKLIFPVPPEAKKHWKGKRLYASKLSVRTPDDPSMIQCYCPATGQHLGTFAATTRDEMDSQIARAAAAQKVWANSPISTRRTVLQTLRRFILDNQNEISRVACRDSGKTRLDALMGEIMVTLEKLKWIIRNGERVIKPSQRPGPSSSLLGFMKNAEVRYEPMGVVSSIVSWNYPFHNLMGPVIAAIFTGNAIVVKCSEQVLWSSRWFTELVRMVLRLLDVDQDLVQLCCCYPDDAEYFTSHPQLSHITFIGSKTVAHHVLQSASKQLTPCVVELGGKDSFIVLDDVADVPGIASIIMRGTFQSAGQNCIGIERVICLPESYAQLLDIFATRIPKLRIGSDIDQLDEIDVGAMISDNRFGQIEDLIKDAVSKGARLLCGGKPFTHPNYPQGHYFEPTLLADVDESMDIFHHEVFGPVLTLIRAKDAQDAVRLSNANEFGLGASIFGSSHRQVSEIADQLECGNVAINDFATFYVAQLPFGGIKKSGYGKFGGEEGLTGLCHAKSIVMDKPLLRYFGVATKIPPPVDYPIQSDKKAWKFVYSLNVASYDWKVWEVIKAFKRLAKGGA